MNRDAAKEQREGAKKLHILRIGKITADSWLEEVKIFMIREVYPFDCIQEDDQFH